MLTKDNQAINKKFMEYFWPTVFIAMATDLAFISDSIIVGNFLGNTALAAVDLLSSVVQIYMALCNLIGIGATALISVAKGKNDEAAARRIYQTGLFSLLSLAALFMVLQLAFFSPITHFLTGEEGIRSALCEYYLIYIFTTPFLFLMSYLSFMVRLDGKPRLASVSVVVSNAGNIVLSVLLIRGLNLGIRGVALGTLAGQLIGLALLARHFLSSACSFRFSKDTLINQRFPKAKAGVRELGGIFLHIFYTGLSGTAGELLIFVRMLFLNWYVQRLSANADLGLVALSVSTNCQVLISTFITGAAETMIPIIGVMLGLKDYHYIRQTFRKAMKILVLSSVAVTTALLLFPDGFAAVFGIRYPKDLQMVVPAIRISALGFLGLSAAYLLLLYYMAVEKERLALAISVINGIALIIPLSLLLGSSRGVDGLWWAFTLSQYGTVLLTALLVRGIRARAKGRYEDFYLLDPIPKSEKLAFSLTNDPSIISETTGAIREFLDQNQIDPLLANRVALAVEERAVLAKGKSGDVNLDIRISLEEEQMILSIRDNGALGEEEETETEALSNLGVLRSLAQRIEDTNVIGFHQTTIVLKKLSEGEGR